MRTIKLAIVGAVIRSADGQVLLGQNGSRGVYQGLWVVPGGRVETGETQTEALRREMLEEVGIDIQSFPTPTLLDDIQTGTSEKTLRETGERVLAEMTFYNFLVESNLAAADMPIRAEDDLATARWFTSKELAALNFSPSVRQTLVSLGYLE